MKLKGFALSLFLALVLAACAGASGERPTPTGELIGECTETEFIWGWDITHYPKTANAEDLVEEVCLGLTGNTCSAVLKVTGGTEINRRIDFSDGTYMNIYVQNPCLSK